jgi:hypothetical protein
MWSVVWVLDCHSQTGRRARETQRADVQFQLMYLRRNVLRCIPSLLRLGPDLHCDLEGPQPGTSSGIPVPPRGCIEVLE